MLSAQPPQSCAGCGRRAACWPPPGRTRSSELIAPQLIWVGEPANWADLPSGTKQMIRSLGEGDLLIPDTARAWRGGHRAATPAGCARRAHRAGRTTPFTAEDKMLLTVLAGRLGQGLQRVHQLDQQRETASGAAGRDTGSGSAAKWIRRALPARHAAASGRRRLV